MPDPPRKNSPSIQVRRISGGGKHSSPHACRHFSPATAQQWHARPCLLMFVEKPPHIGGKEPLMMKQRDAKFQIGQVVRHRVFPFRGVIFDVDPEYANTEEWWNAIPAEVRPSKDQPFYHLLAENDEAEYVAYVSEQNLVSDDSGRPMRHSQVNAFFDPQGAGQYKPKAVVQH
jgi:heat shock protein HspQ